MPFVYQQAFGNIYYVPWPKGSYDEKFVEELEHLFMLHPASNQLPLARRAKAGVRTKTPPDPRAIYGRDPWTSVPQKDFIIHGYSGTSGNRHNINPHLIDGQNNPDDQEIANIGPIPRGRYRISDIDHHSSKGRLVLDLDPLPKSASYPGTNTFHRSNFRIHGANPLFPNDSSEGCIVIALDARNKINDIVSKKKDRLLIVTR